MSACLIGKPVRYDGGSVPLSDQIVAQWLAEGRVLSVCPEVEAGMDIPRAAAEIIGGDGRSVAAGMARVVEWTGNDVTAYFEKGAGIALAACLANGITVAVLTESSPSCGSSTVYDGRFSGTKVAGEGVTTTLLRKHGIRVFSQHQIVEADRALRAGEGGA